MARMATIFDAAVVCTMGLRVRLQMGDRMRFEDGSVFAGYTVLSRLGRGGMATVYLVREPGLERLVALKVLPEQLVDDPKFASRFEQEARIVAGLDHPSIIPLYRYGITDDVPWMALRYVDGGDFEARMAARPLATAEGLAIFRGVAAALDYAHSKGVLHRDMKPQNILLTTQGSAYLADFGVAKLLAGSDRLKTATGSIFGTPAYMAPEQALDNPLGPYTDVYALAVIAFRWLTGSLPFDADTPHAILLKHVQQPLPPTEMRLLSAGVASVIERGLAKDPQDRFQTAGALISELEHALQLVATVPLISVKGSATFTPRSERVAKAPPPSQVAQAATDYGQAKSTTLWKTVALLAFVLAAGIGGYTYWRIANSSAPPITTQAAAPAVTLPTPTPAPREVSKSPTPPTPSEAAITVAAKESVSASPAAEQPTTSPLATGTLLVETNADCRLSVDGAAKGVLHSAASQKTEIAAGEHRVLCVSTERKTINVGQTKTVAVGQQAVVTLDLQAKIADAIKSEDEQKAQQANLADEQGKRDEAKQAEDARAAEEQRKARDAEAARAAEEQRQAQEARDARYAAGKAEAQQASSNGGLIDQGNGVLKDTKTGLEWTQRGYLGPRPAGLFRTEAKQYCESRGWRLPHDDELLSIYDKSGALTTRCGTSFMLGRPLICKVSPLFQLPVYVFWSENQIVNLTNGAVHTFAINSATSGALCVRSH